MVVRVGHKNPAAAVHTDAGRPIQLRRHRRSAIAAGALDTSPGHRADNAPNNLPQPLVSRIADQQRSSGTQRQRRRPSHCCRDCQTTIAAEARHACARQRRDHAARVHRTNAPVPRVGDIQRAIASDGQTLWLVQLRRDCRAAVSGKALGPRPRHDNELPRKRGLKHLVRLCIRDIKIACRVIRNGVGTLQV